MIIYIMGDYGSETDRINDMVRQHQESYTAGLGDETNSLQTIATENWNSQSADYLSKYGHLAEGGGAEIAGAFGLKGIYKGGQKLKGLYDKYQNKASSGEDSLVDNKTGNPTDANSEVPENLRPEDVPEIPKPDPTPQSSTVPDTQPDLVEVSNEGKGPTVETGLKQELPVEPEAPAPETENLVEQTTKQAAEKATEDVGEGLVEKGLTSGLGDLAAAAIPVVGEAVLGVAGLVSIGEGIYHLFHHKSKQPTVATAVSNVVAPPPTNLTQKYSLALPSIDSASESSASVSSF
jgi:hypothetical protein